MTDTAPTDPTLAEQLGALLVTRELAQAADLDRIATALRDGTLALAGPAMSPFDRLPKTRATTAAKARRAAEVEHAADHAGDDAGDFPDADLDLPLTAEDLTPDHDTNDADAGGIITDYDPDKD